MPVHTTTAIETKQNTQGRNEHVLQTNRMSKASAAYAQLLL